MHRDDLDKWQEKWDKANEEGVFGDSPKPVSPSPQAFADDFFGVHRPSGETTIRDVDADYWKQVYRRAAAGEEYGDPLDDPHAGMAGEDMATISEDNSPVDKKELAPTTKSDNKTVSKITDDLGGLANPVHTSTRERDASNKVTPNWAGGEDLIELHNMKISLQKLEDKIAADPMMEDKKSKQVEAQINALWRKIDELSISLNPDFRSEYLS